MSMRLRLAACVVVLVSGCPVAPELKPVPTRTDSGGPFARLLSTSADLGPSRLATTHVTVALRPDADRRRVSAWAADHRLELRWRGPDGWAVLSGSPAAMGRALSVAIHDYRSPEGVPFYAADTLPAAPVSIRDDVEEMGRILSYTTPHEAIPPARPLDVPGRALSPQDAAVTYNLKPLRDAGFTGKGETVAVFAFGGYSQSDLDDFSDHFGLPRVTPEMVGASLQGKVSGETTMDLELAHALAPEARLVVVNARDTPSAEGTYVNVAAIMDETDRHYPGAVWSLSIGWGCDRLITAADMAPVRAALKTAHAHGSAVLDASGDLAGLDCRSGQEWSAAPGADDVGLDSVASLPEVTSVGGTTLSTDADGRWHAEAAWFSAVLTLGTGGGASHLFDRPAWQLAALPISETPRRLTPDVSAVADNATGPAVVLGGRLLIGGGTSASAPLWAGISAVVDEFLIANGGHRIGDLNPLLYRIADGARRPAFHDITAGANAVNHAAPGYDMVSGVGTPDVNNFARDVLDIQTDLR